MVTIGVTLPPRNGRDQAYEACGRELLDRSEVLVAVWDGNDTHEVGGTGAIVQHARELGTPVVWVHAGNRRPGTAEPASLGAEQGLVTWERF